MSRGRSGAAHRVRPAAVVRTPPATRTARVVLCRGDDCRPHRGRGSPLGDRRTGDTLCCRHLSQRGCRDGRRVPVSTRITRTQRPDGNPRCVAAWSGDRCRRATHGDGRGTRRRLGLRRRTDHDRRSDCRRSADPGRCRASEVRLRSREPVPRSAGYRRRGVLRRSRLGVRAAVHRTDRTSESRRQSSSSVPTESSALPTCTTPGRFSTCSTGVSPAYSRGEEDRRRVEPAG